MNQALLDRFLELCVIEANSKREALMSERLRCELGRLGLEVKEDGAAAAVGGECGNLISEVMPADRITRAITLLSHMDAVPPGCGESPYLEDGVVRSKGPILSADDRAGLAIILQILNDLRERPLRHLAVQAIFTTSEEAGPTGAGALAREDLHGEFAVVLDTGGPPGQINFESPTAKKIKIVCEGRAAHAGIEPEKGVNALVMACRLVSALPSGRLDEDTTFSLTLMSSGTATNVIPSQAQIEGELRTFKPGEADRLIALLEERAAEVSSSMGGKILVMQQPHFPPFKVDPGNPYLEALLAAAKNEGFRGFLHRSPGGSDANYLNPKGVPAVNVGVGYRHGHSSQEQLILSEFEGTYRWISRYLRGLDAS